jgi:hypothetical protein
MATTNLNIPDITDSQDDKEVTANQAHDFCDIALTDLLSKAMADTNQTLTTAAGAEALGNMVYQFTGALTAGRNVVVPTNKKLYMCENQTTGGFAVTVKTSAGSGVALIPGEHRLLYCDGTNVIPVDPGNVGSFSGTIAGALADQTYTIDQSAAFAYDIVDMFYKLESGTITMDLEIDTVDVTGIAAKSLTTTEGSATATAANSAAIGARLSVALTSGASTPKDLGYTVRYVRT